MCRMPAQDSFEPVDSVLSTVPLVFADVRAGQRLLLNVSHLTIPLALITLWIGPASSPLSFPCTSVVTVGPTEPVVRLPLATLPLGFWLRLLIVTCPNRTNACSARWLRSLDLSFTHTS
jgi:hypothetical protein